VPDINAEARTALIRDRKDSRNKAGNDQVVPLLPEAWSIVEPMLKGRDDEGSLFGVRGASASTAFTRACADLRIDDLHFHDLRHEATSRLFERGDLNMMEIAAITGHKTLAMLKRYTHPRAEEIAAKAAAKAEAAAKAAQALAEKAAAHG
jgi:integrase